MVCPPDSTDLASAELSMPRRSVPSDTHWHHKLEAAQNAIFCKEVFAQVKTLLFKARGGSRFLGHILPQSNFHVKIIFELLTCPCKQFIKLAVHVCRIAEINLQMS